ncbi:MAG: hypothetical protein ABJN40_05950 [Sneathiella sp.]
MDKKLTDKQLATLANLQTGMTFRDAMNEAGYSDKTTISAVNTEVFQDALREGTKQSLESLSLYAVKVAGEILASKTATDKARLDAARLVLDRAGYVAPKAPEASKPGEKSLHELSRQELADRAERLQNEIADRSKLVIDAPVNTPNPSEDVDK